MSEHWERLNKFNFIQVLVIYQESVKHDKDVWLSLWKKKDTTCFKRFKKQILVIDKKWSQHSKYK